jgi:hypothetical protein
MQAKRWAALMADDALTLTPEEIALGWHFCVEFDGLLIGPGWPERACCSVDSVIPCPPLSEEEKRIVEKTRSAFASDLDKYFLQ